MKVGDTVYIFNENRRVYPPAPKGHLWPPGGPIYREHFRPVQIVGETKVSWILQYDNRKVNKKTLEGIYTIEQVDDRCWKNDHAHKLLEYVRSNASVYQLKEIAALMNWHPQPRGGGVDDGRT